MQVIYLDLFKKDLLKIKDKPTKQRIKQAVLKVKVAVSFDEITNIKSVKGKKSAYRLRVGDYRIGVYVSGKVVELVRVAHRKDIYKLFP